jgi:nucleotidyltransferase substrate binding protein (TIGR01987 family)
MRDYLSWAGSPLQVPSPINAIRAGFQINLIDDGDVWVRAKDDRNLMSHVYEPKAFYAIAGRIATDYLPMFEQLLARMVSERSAGD